MLVSSIDYNEYVYALLPYRIERGILKQNQEIEVCNYHNPDAALMKAKAVSLYEFDGLNKVPGYGAAAAGTYCNERYRRRHHRRYHLPRRALPSSAVCQASRPHAGNDLR